MTEFSADDTSVTNYYNKKYLEFDFQDSSFRSGVYCEQANRGRWHLDWPHLFLYHGVRDTTEMLITKLSASELVLEPQNSEVLFTMMKFEKGQKIQVSNYDSTNSKAVQNYNVISIGDSITVEVPMVYSEGESVPNGIIAHIPLPESQPYKAKHELQMKCIVIDKEYIFDFCEHYPSLYLVLLSKRPNQALFLSQDIAVQDTFKLELGGVRVRVRD